MLEVFAAIVILSMFSGTPDERRERLKPYLGLEKKPRWNFYVVFTRSFDEDRAAMAYYSTGQTPATEEAAEAELMKDPGTALIRKAIGQLHAEITDAIHAPGTKSDWRSELNATFQFLDGWDGDVDELGGDRYHIGAKISVDAPEDTKDMGPVSWFVAQMSRVYGWDHSGFGPELGSVVGEFDVVGHEVAGQDPAWVPLTEEDIAYIESREMLGQPIERDHRGPTRDWELFHRDMWDQIHDRTNGRFVTPAELAAVAHRPPAS